MIWQDVVKNFTGQRRRRVDLTFGISYSDDIDKAKGILKDAVDNYDAHLDEEGISIPFPQRDVHMIPQRGS